MINDILVMGDDFPQKTKSVKAGDQWHGFLVLGNAALAAGWDLSCLPMQHRPKPGTHATDHLRFLGEIVASRMSWSGRRVGLEYVLSGSFARAILLVPSGAGQGALPG